MVDLDALKADLNEKAWYIDGEMANRELCINMDTALAIIARHVIPPPAPDRAALVERMAQTIRATWVEWEIDDTAGGKTYAAVAAEAALAAVEAAGWRPPMETTELRPFFGKDVRGG